MNPLSPPVQPGTTPSASGRFAPHWKGHLLQFDPRPLEPYSAASGVRLLLVVALVEGILGPRLGLLSRLGLPVPPAWLRVPLLLGLALALVTWFAGVRPSQMGLRRWAASSTTEKSYFVQVFLLANVVFALLYSGPLRAATASASWGELMVVCVTSVLWGFYQELIYRGILQTELVRRWGAAFGILAANALYTFGPLHFYHFASGSPLRQGVMFAGVFAIGLFFGLLYRRSGNLWMVGIFHGLGDWYIVGLGSLFPG